jgi:hypothetical protein
MTSSSAQRRRVTRHAVGLDVVAAALEVDDSDPVGADARDTVKRAGDLRRLPAGLVVPAVERAPEDPGLAGHHVDRECHLRGDVLQAQLLERDERERPALIGWRFGERELARRSELHPPSEEV